MVDAIQKAKLKNLGWKNRPYASNAGAEERRKQDERWAALNTFIRTHNGVGCATSLARRGQPSAT
jgi:hypothetical protein